MRKRLFINRHKRQRPDDFLEGVQGAHGLEIIEDVHIHGGGGGGGKSQSTEPWGPQKEYLQDIYSQAAELYNTYSSQYPAFSTTAPQSGYTQAGMGALGDFAGSDFNQNIINQGQDVISGLTNASNPNVNPQLYFGSQIGQGATDYLNSFLNPSQPRGIDPNTQGLIDSYLNTSNRNFNESVLPQTQMNALQANAYGGSRQGVAEGIARRGLAETQDATIANMISQQYNQDRNFGLSAANQAYNTLGAGFEQGLSGLTRAGTLLPSMQSLPLQGYNAILQAGQLDQAYLDAQAQEQMARYMYAQDQPYQALQQYMGAINGGGSPGSFSTITGGPESGGLSGALGGALSGAGMAGAAGVLGMTNPVGWAMIGTSALLGSGLLD
jgi:glutaredoxin-related protein